MTPGDIDPRPEVASLLQAMKAKLPELDELLVKCSGHEGYEDPVYRYYHQSWKVYRLQSMTERIASTLHELAPNLPINRDFLEIVEQGTGKDFTSEDNRQWSKVTRPILEAFFHARFFLEMAVRYARTLDAPPRQLPSGWAALLYLYDRR